ncbi:MAG: hypothetical protein HY654_01820 [Acidobacteria bacterium]|nr:hypothetical protein [Acidobacteriota bacterium]
MTTAKTTPLNPIKVTINENICGKTQPDESILVGPAGGLAFGIVTLTGTKANHPNTITVSNEQCRFAPRVQLASAVASLRITSADPILHTTHAYADDERTLFNVALPMPSVSFTRRLQSARIVRLACDSHPWMRGFVILTGEIGAVTGRDGAFTLADVPAGVYELRFWHERLSAPAQRVTVAAGGTTEVMIRAQ